MILELYLDTDPSQIKFSYSERGKPGLASECNKVKIDFNLSHSHEYALYAITCNRLIGVDLEHIPPRLDVEQLAKRFFSQHEYAVISSLPAEKKQEVFYNAWTRKEAYLKATGEGLAVLEEVEVSLAPGEMASLVSIRGNS